MKKLILTACVLTACSLVSAQEKLSTDEALVYARAVSADQTQLTSTPLATDVDALKPAAVRDGEYGGMVLPQKQLTDATLTKATDAVVPIGQLWLLNLTPVCLGQAVAEQDLRVAKVDADGDQVRAPQCALGIRRNSDGSLDLLVYGRTKEPIVTTVLKPIESRQALPLELQAERSGDEGVVTLSILGKYRASFTVTELRL